MPRKKRAPKQQIQILAALDEIEAAQDRLEVKRIARPLHRELTTWVRHKKAELKELGYRGKMPRLKRGLEQVIFDPRPKPEEKDECESTNATSSHGSTQTATNTAPSVVKRRRRRRSSGANLVSMS